MDAFNVMAMVMALGNDRSSNSYDPRRIFPTFIELFVLYLDNISLYFSAFP